MRNIQEIKLIGRLTKESEGLKKSKDGNKEYCNNSVAVNISKDNTVFYSVVAFQSTAKYLSRMERGQLVMIDGVLEVKPYIRKDGTAGAELKVLAGRIYPLQDIKFTETEKEE